MEFVQFANERIEMLFYNKQRLESACERLEIIEAHFRDTTNDNLANAVSEIRGLIGDAEGDIIKLIREDKNV